jgi:hypothetical protein
MSFYPFWKCIVSQIGLPAHVLQTGKISGPRDLLGITITDSCGYSQSLVGNSTVAAVGRSTSRAWGLTNTRITYDPPVINDTNVSNEIATVQVGNDTAGYRSCFMQDLENNAYLNGTARKLTQIAKVPYVMFTAANSPHITYDHCMYSFLQQAGVKNVTWIKFGEDKGIEGNGHFFYLESNSDELFDVVSAEIASRN